MNEIDYLLTFCKVDRLWDIRFAHGVNGKKRFQQYLQSQIHIFEVDIEDDGRPLKNSVILKHEGIGDVKFPEFLEKLKNAGKLLKLDLKSLINVKYRFEFYKQIFEILNTWKDPIIINADIIKGPNFKLCNHNPLPPDDFIKLYNKLKNPKSILSIGLVTGNGPEPYSHKMIRDLITYASKANSHVTLPLRYKTLMLDESIMDLALSKENSVTIWDRNLQMSRGELVKLEQKYGSKVFKDITDSFGNAIY